MNPDTTNNSNLPLPQPAPNAATPAATPVGIPNAQSAPAVNPGATPAIADDGDRIEMEWVARTRQVLLATRSDPYEQNRQLAALKADYMRKRYGKEIKLGE